MALGYAIYQGDANGGPVDFTTSVALITAAPWEYKSPPLAPGEKRNYAIRTVDMTTGQTDLATDAQVSIVTDATGQDVAGRPAPVVQVEARLLIATPGSIEVKWTRKPPVGSPIPTGAKVWMTAAGAATDYTRAP